MGPNPEYVWLEKYSIPIASFVLIENQINQFYTLFVSRKFPKERRFKADFQYSTIKHSEQHFMNSIWFLKSRPKFFR